MLEANILYFPGTLKTITRHDMKYAVKYTLNTTDPTSFFMFHFIFELLNIFMVMINMVKIAC